MKRQQLFKKTIMIFGLTVILLGYQNCSYNMGGSQVASSSVEDLSGLSGDQLEERKAQIILEKKCVGCHNSAMPSGNIDYLTDTAMLQYSGLVVPGEPDLSPLYSVIITGEMPPNEHLSQAEMDQLSHWIKDVMVPNQSGVAPPKVDNSPLTATYTSIFNKIIKVRCLGCHTTGNVSGQVNLRDYNTTNGQAKKIWLPGNANGSLLYTEVNSGSMPTSGADLSPEEVKAIKDWIDAGAKNN